MRSRILADQKVAAQLQRMRLMGMESIQGTASYGPEVNMNRHMKLVVFVVFISCV